MTTFADTTATRGRLIAAIARGQALADQLYRQARRHERFAAEAAGTTPPMPDAARLHREHARRARVERLGVLDLVDAYRDELDGLPG